MDLQTVLISIFGSGGMAWAIVKMYMKTVAKEVVDESLIDLDAKYVTKEEMQTERKELLEEVERKFLTIYAFREFEKRIEEHFKTTDRRFADSSKRFDKVDTVVLHHAVGFAAHVSCRRFYGGQSKGYFLKNCHHYQFSKSPARYAVNHKATSFVILTKVRICLHF